MWRAERPIYHLYLKALILILRAHLCLTSPQEPKWRNEIASPEDHAPATSMGLGAGARCGWGQGTMKGTEEKAQNSTQEGRRAPSCLCYFTGNTSNVLCVHLMLVRLKCVGPPLGQNQKKKTLPWIVLLTLSVSIELVSSSARVKFQKGVSVS